jgi:hypothetical protein
MECDCGGTGWLPTAIATAAAVAALLSVWFSRQAVERSHRPYVWPEWRLEPDDPESVATDAEAADDESEEEARAAYERLKEERYRVLVRLHNDGPGVALDAQWSVERAYRPRRLRVWELRSLQPLRTRRQLRAMHANLTKMMREGGTRALRESEVRPLGDGWDKSMPDRYLRDDQWSIIVRYSDTAGRRWEFREPAFSRLEIASRPRRVYRRLRRDDDGEQKRWRYDWDW